MQGYSMSRCSLVVLLITLAVKAAMADNQETVHQGSDWKAANTRPIHARSSSCNNDELCCTTTELEETIAVCEAAIRELAWQPQTPRIPGPGSGPPPWQYIPPPGGYKKNIFCGGECADRVKEYAKICSLSNFALNITGVCTGVRSDDIHVPQRAYFLRIAAYIVSAPFSGCGSSMSTCYPDSPTDLDDTAGPCCTLKTDVVETNTQLSASTSTDKCMEYAMSVRFCGLSPNDPITISPTTSSSSSISTSSTSKLSSTSTSSTSSSSASISSTSSSSTSKLPSTSSSSTSSSSTSSSSTSSFSTSRSSTSSSSTSSSSTSSSTSKPSSTSTSSTSSSSTSSSSTSSSSTSSSLTSSSSTSSSSTSKPSSTSTSSTSTSSTSNPTSSISSSSTSSSSTSTSSTSSSSSTSKQISASSTSARTSSTSTSSTSNSSSTSKQISASSTSARTSSTNTINPTMTTNDPSTSSLSSFIAPVATPTEQRCTIAELQDTITSCEAALQELAWQPQTPRIPGPGSGPPPWQYTPPGGYKKNIFCGGECADRVKEYARICSLSNFALNITGVCTGVHSDDIHVSQRAHFLRIAAYIVSAPFSGCGSSMSTCYPDSPTDLDDMAGPCCTLKTDVVETNTQLGASTSTDKCMEYAVSVRFCGLNATKYHPISPTTTSKYVSSTSSSFPSSSSHKTSSHIVLAATPTEHHCTTLLQETIASCEASIRELAWQPRTTPIPGQNIFCGGECANQVKAYAQTCSPSHFGLNITGACTGLRPDNTSAQHFLRVAAYIISTPFSGCGSSMSTCFPDSPSDLDETATPCCSLKTEMVDTNSPLSASTSTDKCMEYAVSIKFCGFGNSGTAAAPLSDVIIASVIIVIACMHALIG